MKRILGMVQISQILGNIALCFHSVWQPQIQRIWGWLHRFWSFAIPKLRLRLPPKIEPCRILGLCGAIFTILIVTGCGTDGDSVPRIVGNAAHTVLQPVTPILGGNQAPAPVPVDRSIPAAWYPPAGREKGWKAIVLHHSATHKGNADKFDDYHKNGRQWMGVGYDFVIGNGNGSGDGHVEVTFRWREQIAGAHVGGTPRNWANEDAIGICLVGDFTKTSPTPRQMDSLVKLIRFLQKRYQIPAGRIYGHSDTPGYKGRTLCPGKNFSMYSLKRML